MGKKHNTISLFSCARAGPILASLRTDCVIFATGA